MTTPKRLELHLSYDCGQRCAFCSESERMERWRHYPLSTAEVAAVLRAHAEAGFDHVTFTGGEPTAHACLPAALAAARRLGMTTYVTTNGGRFAEETYARKVLGLVDELCVSVHGPDAETHDACAGAPGSFARAARALELAARLSPTTRLATNTVATRLNWDALEATAAFLLARPGVERCLISNAAPEGRAEERYAELSVPVSVWPERIAALNAAFAGSGRTLRFFGLPLCAFSGLTELSNDLHFSSRVTVERAARADGRAGLDAIHSADASRRRVRAAACAGCRESPRCPGVFDRYVEVHGESGLEAIA